MGRQVIDFALGQNVQHKTATFNNTKSVTIYFDKPFKRKPSVNASFSNSSETPVWKPKITKTFCRVRLKQKWTGDVELTIMERL